MMIWFRFLERCPSVRLPSVRPSLVCPVLFKTTKNGVLSGCQFETIWKSSTMLSSDMHMYRRSTSSAKSNSLFLKEICASFTRTLSSSVSPLPPCSLSPPGGHVLPSWWSCGSARFPLALSYLSASPILTSFASLILLWLFICWKEKIQLCFSYLSRATTLETR